jgi:hypothetical protein
VALSTMFKDTLAFCASEIDYSLRRNGKIHLTKKKKERDLSN